MLSGVLYGHPAKGHSKLVGVVGIVVSVAFVVSEAIVIDRSGGSLSLSNLVVSEAIVVDRSGRAHALSYATMNINEEVNPFILFHSCLIVEANNEAYTSNPLLSTH